MHQSLTKKLLYCRCFLSKNSSWMICMIYKTSCLFRGATKGSPQFQWIWRLLQKKNCMSDAHHIFNVINDAWSKKSAIASNFFTAPATQKKYEWSSSLSNTAPATRKQCQDSSYSGMKNHFYYAKRQASLRNLTKWPPRIWHKICRERIKRHFQRQPIDHDSRCQKKQPANCRVLERTFRTGDQIIA